MHDKKSPMANSHYLKNLKQQFRNKNLIETTIHLVKCNDHDSLAFLARTYGVPPQLRHVVWPILLKYHPMCISPNTTSNTISWDPITNDFILNDPFLKSKAPTDKQDKSDDENILPYDIESIILHDLKKYFHSRSNPAGSSSNANTTNIATPTPVSSSDASIISSMEVLSPSLDYEFQIIETLKNAIVKFLLKWSKIFKYESGLAWIALGLAEWYPIYPYETMSPFNETHSFYEVEDYVVLSGRKHALLSTNNGNNGNSNSSSNNTNNNNTNITSGMHNLSINTNTSLHNSPYISHTLSYLYKEYPLPFELRSKLPTKPIFSFSALFERLALVILHCPDTILAHKQLKNDSNASSSSKANSNFNTNYFPIISGGDLSFQTQVFFKVFSSILPELYQPLTEESSLQPSSSRNSWIYWWLKCSGAKALQRQDRGRVWDLLLGWRPKPNMDTINFFLNYNDKKMDHLYHDTPQCDNEQYWMKDWIALYNNDPFWFPDLDSMALGSKKFPYDYSVFKELILRNRYGGTQSKAQKDNTVPSPGSDSNDKSELKLPFSSIDPHMQLIFIFIAILQFNEFKLLEFEEAEISEFLNNVPLLTKFDDSSYRKLYENTESSITSLPSSPTTSTMASLQSSSNSSAHISNYHMLIEVGNDAKASHCFDDLLNMAGDIWRKWLWRELEESSL
ncbi:BDN_1c_G0023360.mRNA.1.CDS.1 [Saccharomyces cerevisiae]|nr:BDN_1c_G0023360.mRNA.1.CDS.1 [Saccharomyces cerevisiae]CAI7113157.1 BDN_1c_G0023360.mRNA.1.CDS.1 [Saccharomyces cerevisiae]